METFLALLPSLMKTNLAVIIQMWDLLMTVPVLVRLPVFILLTWYAFLAYCSLEFAWKAGKLTKPAKVAAVPLLLMFGPADVILNYTVFMAVCGKWPPKITVTQTLSEYHRKEPLDSWRWKVAHWTGHNWLDPFDRDGYHISPDDRIKQGG